MFEQRAVATCLWFDRGQARQAAEFYATIFPNTHIDKAYSSPAAYPSGQAGDELMVEFTLLGQPVIGLNGGPEFKFDEAISFQVYTDNQEQTDRYWNALTADGGEESQCGWLKDKFGLSWQITPRALMRIHTSPDREAARRGMEAMFKMKKIDIATIERAFNGELTP